MIVFRNTYHGTDYRSTAKVGDRLSPRRCRRIRARLCRYINCLCGDRLGEYGPQEVQIVWDRLTREVVLRPLEKHESPLICELRICTCGHLESHHAYGGRCIYDGICWCPRCKPKPPCTCTKFTWAGAAPTVVTVGVPEAEDEP